MDQRMLNTIALDTIDQHRAEAFAELRELLNRDAKKRQEQIPGMAIHHVHNTILFDCLVWLNHIYSFEDDSEKAWKEYIDYAETLLPQFSEIVNNLKDFRPTSIKNKE